MPIRRLALPAAVLVLIAATLIALAPRSATRALAAARPAPAAIETSEPPAPQQAAPVRVAIKPLEPFVAKTDTRYTGFSIELWDEIARRNRWTTNYVWYDTLPPMLEDVSASKVDVGIAGISITRERETRLDFSHPMFNAGQQIL
ncbi:MAG: transporter substrate-binding domain-containing protein, partial [Chloroflexota bacterium]